MDKMMVGWSVAEHKAVGAVLSSLTMVFLAESTVANGRCYHTCTFKPRLLLDALIACFCFCTHAKPYLHLIKITIL